MVSKGKVCNAGHCPSSSSSNSGQPPLACFLIPSPQRCFAPRLHRVKLADLLEENADFFFPEKDSFLMDDGFQCCKQTLFNKFVSYFSPQWLSDHIKKQVLKSFFFSLGAMLPPQCRRNFASSSLILFGLCVVSCHLDRAHLLPSCQSPGYISPFARVTNQFGPASKHEHLNPLYPTIIIR